ncbi:hypothetical protein ACS0TY_017432 [Phlomoides rotata]
MMDDHQRFTLELTGGRFAPSSPPNYHITFNFKFELKISEFMGSEILRRQTEETIEDSIRVSFKIHPDKTTKEVAQQFANDTSEAITTILACLPIRVPDEDSHTLIDFAVGEARQAVRNSMYDGYEAVDLNILVQMEYQQVYDPLDEYCCMVPATDSSVQLLLKEYYDEKIDSDQSLICCICHEELAEHGSLSMPCEHVFHGDCIRRWLSSSHYCPLCRFEMPVETRL